MGTLIITGISSMQCADAGALRDATSSRSQSVARCHPTTADLSDELRLPLGCTFPVELLSTMDAPRHNSAQWITRRVSGSLPPRSLLHLGQGVYSTSPEYFFLKRARSLSLYRACQLAMELCGGYSTLYSIPYRRYVEQQLREDPALPVPVMPPEEWDLGLQQSYDLMANGYIERPPLTNVARLKRFIRTAYGQSRRPVARKAVDLIQDGSRSPGETRMYLLSCLPLRYGGGRLARPELNKRIDLTHQTVSLTRSHHFEVDMYWRGKVVAEYDGRVHSNDERRIHDDERRLVLGAMGYRVFVLDHESLKDPLKMDSFVQQIAHEIGQHLYPPRDPQRLELKRRELRQELFDYEFDLYRASCKGRGA